MFFKSENCVFGDMIQWSVRLSDLNQKFKELWWICFSEISTLKEIFGIASDGMKLIISLYLLLVDDRKSLYAEWKSHHFLSLFISPEHEAAMVKYSRLPKKRENEKVNIDVIAHLYVQESSTELDVCVDRLKPRWWERWRTPAGSSIRPPCSITALWTRSSTGRKWPCWSPCWDSHTLRSDTRRHTLLHALLDELRLRTTLPLMHVV